MTYTPPTGPEMRALLLRWGLTGRAAADLAGVTPLTVRRWTGAQRNADGTERHPCPFAALYTLAHRCEGVGIEPDEWRLVI